MNNGTYRAQSYKIKKIMNDITAGEYIIPNFQRDFVWKPKQIIGLLQSIQRRYPIGVLTISTATNSIFSEGKNEFFDFFEEEQNKSNWVVVDGQQRLTSLASVYFINKLLIGKESFSTENVKFIEKISNEITFYDDKFLTKKELKEKILEKTRWENSLIAAELKRHSLSNPDTHKKVIDILDNFELHILKLEGWDNTNVINIFTAMNSGSKKLTHVELMNGSMFNIVEGFDLLKEIKNINSKYPRSGSIKDVFMVQLMKIYFDITSGLRQINYRKDELLRWSMDTEEVKTFVENINDFKKVLIKSISDMDTKWNFYSLDWLPKNIYLMASLALNLLSRNIEIKDSHWDKVVSLITRRLLNGDYASSPGVKSIEDINAYIIPLVTKSEITHSKKELMKLEDRKVKQKLQDEIIKLRYINKGSSLFKLAMSILSQQQPRHLFKKGFVNIRPTEVTKFDADLHHFIPKNSEFVKTYYLPIELIDTIGNVALISEDENRKKIRNHNPRDYMEKSEEIYGEDYKYLLKSHLIDKNDLEQITKINIETSSQDVYNFVRNFINNRAMDISDLLFEFYIKY